jgi:hypothetical protein
MWNPCIWLGDIKWYGHCGKVWHFFKRLNPELPYNPVIPLSPKGYENICEHKILYMIVYSSVIHNGIKAETTTCLLFIARKMRCGMCPHNVITLNTRSEAVTHCTKWMNADNIIVEKCQLQKDHMLYDFHVRNKQF